MQMYPPEQMMQPAELKQARRLLRRLDRLHAEVTENGNLPRHQRKDDEQLTKRRHLLDSELDALCAVTWKREVGLERYSVLHARRGDFEARFQLLSFDVSDSSGWAGKWMWSLNGRALRKDGTLGFNHEGIGFRFALLSRRHLDGIWRELCWPNTGSG